MNKLAGELFEKYWMQENGLWQKRLQEVVDEGFENASPIARLIYSCEIGQIDQHASEDLKAVSAFIETAYDLLEVKHGQ